MAPCTFKAQTTNPQEISSHDVEPTFKLQAERNLVMVRVVVRDAKGAAVDNLRKEDFHLFDHGKLQTILHFSLEKPALKAAEPRPPKPAEKTAAEPEDADETAMPASAARRFVALYFDDVNTPFENLARARDAADHFLTQFCPARGSRGAVHLLRAEAIGLHRQPCASASSAFRPSSASHRGRGYILRRDPPYEAYLIVDHQDPIAIAVAADEILNCNPCPAQAIDSSSACPGAEHGAGRGDAVADRSLKRSRRRPCGGLNPSFAA